jgi:hypothetical protein
VKKVAFFFAVQYYNYAPAKTVISKGKRSDLMKHEEMLDKDFHGTPAGELASAPVYALRGLSRKDAALLKKAFGVDTIADLAGLKYHRWAVEICGLAETAPGAAGLLELKDKLDKKFEKTPARKLPGAPLHALQGLSRKDSTALARAFRIKTVRSLAGLKYIQWAREIMKDVDSARPSKRRAEAPGERAGKSRSTLAVLLLIAAVVIIALVYFLRQGKEKGESPAGRPETPVVESRQMKPAGGRDEAGLYTVKPGDTLIIISEQNYGTYEKWKDIYEANRETIASPVLIFPGQKLRLPGTLTK